MLMQVLGHSFRRGGASFALSCGVSDELIMMHNNRKSQCYLICLDTNVKISHLIVQAIINL